MYCPQCGQQQVSDSTRFCSRCGLPVSGLAEWMASGGGLAASVEAAPQALASPRRKGVRQGAKLMFFSGVLLPIFFGLSVLFDGVVPLIVPFTVFLAGLSLMLYSRLFVEEIPAQSRQVRPHGLGSMSGVATLPPASDAGISSVIGRQVRTSELVQPPSVTENTTRLLDKD